jgi:hypothetical protein
VALEVIAVWKNRFARDLFENKFRYQRISEAFRSAGRSSRADVRCGERVAFARSASMPTRLTTILNTSRGLQFNAKRSSSRSNRLATAFMRDLVQPRGIQTA